MNEPVGFSMEPNGLDGMADSLSDLFDSFQKLASDPANFGRRRAVIRSAQKLAAQFNQASSRLKSLEIDLNAIIRKDVDGGLARLQRGLNTLAGHLISRVNTIYRAGRDLNGGTGRDLFTGVCASDIGVNPAVVSDPARLQAGGAAGAHGNNAVAQALAKLGGRNVAGPGNTLSSVNNDLAGSRARGGSPDEKKANLRRRRPASAVSAKTVTTFDELTPAE
jgi:flagellar hook-associated protein FlgK